MPMQDIVAAYGLGQKAFEPSADLYGALGKAYEAQLLQMQRAAADRQIQQMRGETDIERQQLQNQGYQTAQEGWLNRIDRQSQQKIAHEMMKYGAQAWNPDNETFDAWYAKSLPIVEKSKVGIAQSIVDKATNARQEYEDAVTKNQERLATNANTMAWIQTKALLSGSMAVPGAGGTVLQSVLPSKLQKNIADGDYSKQLSGITSFEKLVAADKSKWPEELRSGVYALIADHQARSGQLLAQLEESNAGQTSRAMEEPLRQRWLASERTLETIRLQYADVWHLVNEAKPSKEIPTVENPPSTTDEETLPIPPAQSTADLIWKGIVNKAAKTLPWARAGADIVAADIRKNLPDAAFVPGQAGMASLPSPTSMPPSLGSLGRGLWDGVKSLPSNILSEPRAVFDPTSLAYGATDWGARMATEQFTGGSPWARAIGEVIPSLAAGALAGKMVPRAISIGPGYAPNLVKVPPTVQPIGRYSYIPNLPTVPTAKQFVPGSVNYYLQQRPPAIVPPQVPPSSQQPAPFSNPYTYIQYIQSLNPPASVNPYTYIPKVVP